MARGGHGFPRVSLWPTMPDPSMLCRQATYRPAYRVGGRAAASLQVSFTLFGHPTPCAYGFRVTRTRPVLYREWPLARLGNLYNDCKLYFFDLILSQNNPISAYCEGEVFWVWEGWAGRVGRLDKLSLKYENICRHKAGFWANERRP
jgi:hypothetical protein